MSYVKRSKYNTKNKKKKRYVMSSLQESILKHVCVSNDANYDSLRDETHRKRTTIIQSIAPLRDRHYIEPHRSDPSKITGKLIFRPTAKGIYHAAAFLNVDIDNILDTIFSADEMKDYNEFIKTVPNYSGRKELFIQTAKLFLKYNLFDARGNLVTTDHRELFNLGLKLSVLESARKVNYLPTDFLNAQSIETLFKITTSKERDEIIEYISNAKDNLDLTVKHLREQFHV